MVIDLFGRFAFGVTKMMAQLSSQRPLHHPFLQLCNQPVFSKDLLRADPLLLPKARQSNRRTLSLISLWSFSFSLRL
jgi:hypothetical protein